MRQGGNERRKQMVITIFLEIGKLLLNGKPTSKSTVGKSQKQTSELSQMRLLSLQKSLHKDLFCRRALVTSRNGLALSKKTDVSTDNTQVWELGPIESPIANPTPPTSP